MKQQYWTPTKRSLPTQIQRTFKGVNKLDSFSISEEYDTDQKNISTAEYPTAKVRQGYTLFKTLAGRVTGLGAWKDTELHAISNGAWIGPSTSLASGLSITATWSFCNFKGNLSTINLIGANGVDPVKRYDGTTVQNLTNAPTGANYIEQFADRLFCAVGNDLKFSGYRQADNWSTVLGDDTDPGYITIETPDGEQINAVKAGIGHLTIFKPSAMFELFGYSPQDYTVKPVSYDIGAVSHQAVVTVDGVMYFVHRTGLYKYAGGTAPTKQWSSPIQDYIDRINPSQASKVCMGTDGKILYIGLPLDSATEPDTIIEYNTEFGTFSIWKDFAPLHIKDIAGSVYIGGVEGQVRKLGGTTDNGSPISWYRITKPFNQGSLSQKTRIKRAWIVADVPAGSSLIVSISKSDSANDWETVQSIQREDELNRYRLTIPTMAAYNANWIRFKFEGTGPSKIIEFAYEMETLPIY